jgi:hypothetical protein
MRKNCLGARPARTNDQTVALTDESFALVTSKRRHGKALGP